MLQEALQQEMQQRGEERARHESLVGELERRLGRIQAEMDDLRNGEGMIPPVDEGWEAAARAAEGKRGC